MFNIKPKYLNHFIRLLPNFLWPIRWYLIKKSLKVVGQNFKFGYNSEFSDPRLIEIGDNVFMGLNTVINSNVPVFIGNNVMFGRNVTILGGDHNISEVGKPMRFVKTGGLNVPVIIEDDVWVGANTTILKGVTIGEGSVIGAGSLVNKTLPPYSICVGNPCKPIKLRFIKDDLRIHLKQVKSKYSLDKITSYYE